MRDPSHFLDRLSVPSDAPLIGGPSLGRRRFLQAALIGAGVVATAPLLSKLEAFAASPVGAYDGILVHITLGGGNDALNTLAPVDDALYRSLRPTIAVSNNAAIAPRLAGSPSLALHPALAKLRARYAAGDVAFIRGVGYQPPNLSHFQSMGTWMQGWTGSPVSSGWLGRYLDGLPNATTEPLYGVTLDSSVGLHLVGNQTRATSIRPSLGGYGASTGVIDKRQYDTLRAVAGTPLTGLAMQYAQATRTMVDLPPMLTAPNGDPARNVYVDGLPANGIERNLGLCARLVNADLGIRVLNVSHGSYDTHNDQAGEHANRLAELDAAIERFFATLDPRFADRVTVMAHSEFSRRPRENDSRGTDHGTAGLVIVAGRQVRGGLYGDAVDLNRLESGNLPFAVDFRSVYASVLDGWFGADSRQILGKTYEKLPFLDQPGPARAPVAPVTIPGGSGVPVTQPPAARAGGSRSPMTKRRWLAQQRKRRAGTS